MFTITVSRFLSYFLIFAIFKLICSDFLEDRKNHRIKIYSIEEIQELADMLNKTYFIEVLNMILVPRVVGTVIHEQVKQYITFELEKSGWNVEYHEFIDEVPNKGKMVFTNIIAHFPAKPLRRLVLACHYDTKDFGEQFNFVGATDSAVPCTMIINMARVFSTLISNATIGMTLIFFDGEEAFGTWSGSNSLFGSRALAAKWESEPFPTNTSATNTLHRIDLMILLDLIGVKHQNFYCNSREAEQWHSHMSEIERKLKGINGVYNFHSECLHRSIADDHVPFKIRGVPILHVFPGDFPSVWHTSADNSNSLYFPDIYNVHKVTQIFAYSYIQGRSLMLMTPFTISNLFISWLLFQFY